MCAHIFWLSKMSCHSCNSSYSCWIPLFPIARTRQIFSWGRGLSGQLGNGTNVNENIPISVITSGVLAKKTLIQISTGDAHILALDSGGKVYAWGNNSSGELGNDTTQNSNIPLGPISGLLSGKRIVNIAAGTTHSLAVDSEGIVYAWGANTSGQLGNNSTTSSLVPIQVDNTGVLAGKQIISVAAGNVHSLALDSNGKVYSWGGNLLGQLGDGTNGAGANKLVPVSVVTSGVLNNKVLVRIAAGSNISGAVDSNGSTYTWGFNSTGQLGIGIFGGLSNVPVAVNTSGVLAGKFIVDIVCGTFFMVALDSGGKVYTWGVNSQGQLGDGNLGSPSNVPVGPVAGLLSDRFITRIDCGQSHSIVLSRDGSVYTWGGNFSGQLGNENNTDSDVPVKVNLNAITIISAGGETSVVT